MAKKGMIERITETFMPGDREPGEVAPADDSHIAVPVVPPIVGEMDDPEPKPEPDQDKKEELLKVEIAGVIREVDKETYDLVMLERAAAEELPAPAPVPAITPKEPEFDEVEFFSNPGEALKKIKEEAIAEASQNIQKRYSADKAQESFWGSFYQENPKLQGEEMLVKLTLASNMKELKNISDGKTGRDALAEKVEIEMLRIANKQRGHKTPDDSTRLEGGSATTTVTTESSDQIVNDAPSNQRPPSIGDEIKARKLRRDRARRGETSTQLS